MIVTLDLPDSIVEILLEWYVPEGLAGPTIEDRLFFIAQEAADGLRDVNKRDQLYSTFGIKRVDDDWPEA